MPASISTHIKETELLLFADRTAFLPAANTLVISDVHLGKVIHFRKEGIPIPEAAGKGNLIRIHEALSLIQPKEILFLGDLFHSDYNREWEDLAKVRAHFSNIRFSLVHGNHDILDEHHYQRAGIELLGHDHIIKNVLFTHEPLEEKHPHLFNLAGHVHPKVKLSGKGNQSVVLPCFYFGKTQGLMPAFGDFTGGYKVRPKQGDQVYGIAEDTVLKLSE